MIETIRSNTFETNSSSCHSLTILTDKEYNDLKNGKGFILDDKYFEPTLENFTDFWKGEIDGLKSSVKYTKETNLSRYVGYKEKGIRNLSVEERKCIDWHFNDKTITELEEQLDKQITYYNDTIDTYNKEIEKLSKLDIVSLFNWFTDNINAIVEYINDNDKLYDQNGELSNTEHELLNDYLSELDTYDTYYDNYEYESFEGSRTLESGETVHVIGYYGYDG